MKAMMCTCCMSPQDKRFKDADRIITKQIEQYRKENRHQLKLLLLGTGESGKSTFVKQMRILHGTGYNSEDCREFTYVVYQNLFMLMQDLIRAMDLLKVSYEDPENKTRATLVAAVEYRTVLTLEEPYIGALQSLWKDSGIQECYRRRREFQLSDSAHYFLSDIQRIVAPDYLPSQQDVLRVRVPTTGILEYSFKVSSCSFRMIDVGGQRSERRRWIHCFSKVQAIVFLTAISEFDQVLFEDKGVNRLVESTNLFKTIIEQECFLRTSVILFLNKKDLLEEKVEHSNLADYFPAYTGPKKDALAARDFILDMFLDIDKKVAGQSNEQREIYPHFTCATDTNNIRVVFNCVKDKIITEYLMEIGVL